MMIEAFDEVVNDQPSVESCKVWLLRQKETRSWKTTKEHRRCDLRVVAYAAPIC